jgi:SAM-dependent methyltransferase
MTGGSSESTTTAAEVTSAWQAALGHGAYEHHCRSRLDYLRVRRLGRAWSLILRKANPPRGAHIFELGCGGGINLAKLATHGYRVHGIDVSPEVVARARGYLDEVARFKDIRASVEVADIFDYRDPTQFDMVFHNGVVEHFLDDDNRRAIWERLAALTVSGGAVVSIVPCGAHFMRARVRAERLCGYDIAEIDYTCASHRRELERAGLVDIRCYPTNYFDFLRGHPNRWIARYAHKAALIAGAMVMPVLPVAESIKERVADSLIVIARRA